MPWWTGTTLFNKCPPHQRLPGDPQNPNLMAGTYWGCTYNASTDRQTQNLQVLPLIIAYV